MTGCLLVGATVLSLAQPGFSLSWEHSVEKIEWREDWAIEGQDLILTRVAIKGSGAGMDPADEARLENGWWVWEPDSRLPELRLAASGATGSGWQLCSGGECRELGTTPDAPIRIAPCGGNDGNG
ncbi:MAG: DUF1850 domain-containing protein [Pseudorhodobacter sp.]